MVICDGCDRGYHYTCHTPQLSAEDIPEDDPWFCMCVTPCGLCSRLPIPSFLHLVYLTSPVPLFLGARAASFSPGRFPCLLLLFIFPFVVFLVTVLASLHPSLVLTSSPSICVFVPSLRCCLFVPPLLAPFLCASTCSTGAQT